MLSISTRAGSVIPVTPEELATLLALGVSFSEPERPDNDEQKPEPERVNFGAAINLMKRGYKMAREGWNAKALEEAGLLSRGSVYVALQRPTTMSKMTEPYIYIKNAQGGVIPWLASQGDMLAEDWVVVE